MATQPVDVPFEEFTRAEWTALAEPAESRLSPTEVATLTATGDPASLDEVADVYVPLAQLLAVYSSAVEEARRRVDGFLGRPTREAPFVIGVAGSVAVGKSTTARLLQAVLHDSPGRPTVELITTDGFLYPNAELEARGLMDRKGFPESYDRRRMIEVLSAIKAGSIRVEIPVYSHVTYDIVPGEFQVVERPAMVIVEGLNVLRSAPPTSPLTRWLPRTSSISPSMSTPTRPTSPGGSPTGSSSCARVCSSIPIRTFTRLPRCPPSKCWPSPAPSGRISIWSTSTRTSPRPPDTPFGPHQGRRPSGPPGPIAKDLKPVGRVPVDRHRGCDR